MEGVLGEHGQDHGEIEGQEPDHQHHEKREPELLATSGVAQALLDAASSGRRRSARLARPDDEQGGDDGQIGQCVEPEAHRRAHRHDQHAGQSGPDHAGAVDHHPVEAHRARQILGRHEAADQCLAGGRVGDLDETPRDADSDQTPTLAAPAAASAHNSAAKTQYSVWVRTRSLRRSTRSATAPPQGPSNSEGIPPAARTNPRSPGEPVSSRTSQPIAVCCKKVPLAETTWPPK